MNGSKSFDSNTPQHSVLASEIKLFFLYQSSSSLFSLKTVIIKWAFWGIRRCSVGSDTRKKHFCISSNLRSVSSAQSTSPDVSRCDPMKLLVLSFM